MRPLVAKSRSLLPSRNTVVATLVLSSLASVLAAASQPASLRIDGQRITSDVPPVTSIKGEAFVPLRVVAETLGAETDYDAKSGTVELSRGKNVLRLRAGENAATMNGKPIVLQHAPFEVRGRMMVALGTIARAFGSKVSYDRPRAKIEVMTPGMVEAGAQSDEL
jgi:hypothetical protein